MTITFYDLDQEYGEFSNLSPHGILLDGLWWPTCEHYFQAQKFVGTPYPEVVRTMQSAKAVATFGKSEHLPLRPDWEQVKDDVMRRAVLCKFRTHHKLRALLLSTGNEPIIENAPRDAYWGCGPDGKGKNMLGKILVEVRTLLRDNPV